MDKPFDARSDFDEGTVVSQDDDLTLDLVTDLEVGV